MRIIIVVSSLQPGGAERVSLDIARYMIEAGNEVHLFIARLSKKTPAVYEIPNGVYGYHLSFTAESKILRTVANLFMLKKMIREINPDWVISLGAQYKLLMMSGVLESHRVLLSERNWPKSFYTESERAAIEKTYLAASRVVFQTPEARNCFCEEIRNKGIVIPNPVPTGLPQWYGAESRRIIYYGRLEPQKRPEVALEAFRQFRSSHEGYYFEIYGAGSCKKMLESYIKKWDLGNCVSIHSPSKDVHLIASGCLMFVSSSDYEGISNSMLEALSMGMPCVCTDCAGGGASLVIENGTSGILVPCGDSEAMAQAMAKIADSAKFASELSEGALLSVKKFSREYVFSQWISLLQGGACW